LVRKKVKKINEEVELLKLQLKARGSELEEVRKELNEIHASISYRFGRWVAETRIGGWLKKVLRKYP
jgi:hypothetical protein